MIRRLRDVNVQNSTLFTTSFFFLLMLCDVSPDEIRKHWLYFSRPESDWVVHLQVCRRFLHLHYFSFEGHRRLLSAFACDFVTSISGLLHESHASWSTPQVIQVDPPTEHTTKKEKRDESRKIVIRQHHQHHITLHPLSRRNKKKNEKKALSIRSQRSSAPDVFVNK